MVLVTCSSPPFCPFLFTVQSLVACSGAIGIDRSGFLHAIHRPFFRYCGLAYLGKAGEGFGRLVKSHLGAMGVSQRSLFIGVIHMIRLSDRGSCGPGAVDIIASAEAATPESRAAGRNQA